MITTSDAPVEISGTASSCRWPQCSASLTPMNARIRDSPVERYTSRSSSPVTRKYSARRPSSAKALAANTM